MMPIRRQAGFSLVELMVALVIGLVILLAAGTIFLGIQRSMTRVNELADQQSDLLFVSDMLLNELREAAPGTVDDGYDAFSLMLEGKQIRYSLGDSDGDKTLYRQVDGGPKEPMTTQRLVLIAEAPLLEPEPSPGTWRLNLVFNDDGEPLRYSLIATQRNCILSDVSCS